MTTDIRESVILAFNTHLDMVRTLRVPDPDPELDTNRVNGAVTSIIMSDIFDDDRYAGTGRPLSLRSAVHERVESTVLF